MVRFRVRASAWLMSALIAAISPVVSAQQSGSPTGTPPEQSAGAGNAPPADQPLLRDRVFDMGEIEVVGTTEGTPGVGGAILSRDQMWTFDRNSLDQAVNLIPGVISNMDSNGRRNESDIFVRGFGRWQVPLTLDGVRIYLPADNRLDFSRFLTADIAAVQVQKGYASVLDGPGGMVKSQANHHLTKNVYIGETKADGQFKILKSFKDVKGEPFLKGTFKAKTTASN